MDQYRYQQLNRFKNVQFPSVVSENNYQYLFEGINEDLKARYQQITRLQSQQGLGQSNIMIDNNLKVQPAQYYVSQNDQLNAELSKKRMELDAINMRLQNVSTKDTEILRLKDYISQMDNQYLSEIRALENRVMTSSDLQRENAELQKKLSIIIIETENLNQSLRMKNEENEQLKLRIKEFSRNQDSTYVYSNEILSLKNELETNRKENERLKNFISNSAENEQKLVILTEQLQQVNSMLGFKNDENERLRQQILKLESQTSQLIQITTQLNQYEQQFSSKQNQILTLQKDLEQQNYVIQEKNSEIKMLRYELQKGGAQFSDKQDEVDQLKKTIASLKQQIFEQRSDVTSLYGFKSENDRLYSELREREIEIENLRRKLTLQQSEVDDLKQQTIIITSLSAQLEECRLKYDNCEAWRRQLSEKCDDFDIILQERAQMEVQIKNFEQTIFALQEERRRLEDQLHSKQSEIEIMKVEINQASFKQGKSQEYQLQITRLNEELEQWRQKYERLEFQFSESRREEQAKYRLLQNEIESIKQKHSRALDQQTRQMDEEVRRIRSEVATQKGISMKLENELRAKDGEQEQSGRVYKEENETLKKKLSEISRGQENEVLRLKNEIQQWKEKCQRIEVELTNEKGRIQSTSTPDEKMYQQKIQQLQTVLGSKEQEIEIIKKRFGQMQIIKIDQSEREQFRLELRSLEQRILQLQQENSDLRMRSGDRISDVKISALNDEIGRLKSELNHYKLSSFQNRGDINFFQEREVNEQ